MEVQPPSRRGHSSNEMRDPSRCHAVAMVFPGCPMAELWGSGVWPLPAPLALRMDTLFSGVPMEFSPYSVFTGIWGSLPASACSRLFHRPHPPSLPVSLPSLHSGPHSSLSPSIWVRPCPPPTSGQACLGGHDFPGRLCPSSSQGIFKT